jgi:chromate transporter
LPIAITGRGVASYCAAGVCLTMAHSRQKTTHARLRAMTATSILAAMPRQCPSGPASGGDMTVSGTRPATGRAPAVGAERRVTRRDLFLGYLEIGLLGFGGIAPWARHVIVEEREWLSEAEYAAILGVGQVLPGPNTMNSAVMIGDRFQGALGSLLALSGLMAMPLVILIALAAVYARFAAVPQVEAALAGAAAGAAGLVIGTALKMARQLRPTPLAVLLGAIAFAAVGVLQLSLVPVVVVLAPVSIAGMALERRWAGRHWAERRRAENRS